MNEKTVVKERYACLDLLKVIAITTVIFGHAFTVSCDILDKREFMVYFHYFFRTIFSTCVPLFFFINGMLLLNHKLDIKKHCFKIIRLMILTVIWKVMDVVLLMLIREESLTPVEIIKTVWNWVDGYSNELWFLPALAVLYIFLPLIKAAYDHDKKSYYFFFGVVVLLTFGNHLLNTVLNLYEIVINKNYVNEPLNFFNNFNAFQGIFGYSIGYFMWGGIICHYKDRLDNRNNRIIAALCIFISMLLLSMYGILRSEFEYEVYDGVWDGFESIFTLINVTAIYVISLKFKNTNRIGHVIRFIGANTLGIYLLQTVVLAVLLPHFAILYISNNIIINALFVVFVLMLCLILTQVIKKIPMVRNLLIL